MSEGSVYQRKSDKRWVAQWKDAQGKTRYKYRTSKALAKKALREAIQARDEGIVPIGKLTLNDLLDSWFEDQEGTVSRRTLENRQSAIRCHVRDTIGPQRLTALSHKDFSRLYRKKVSTGQLKASSCRRLHTMLKQAFGEAVRRRYLNFNPLQDVKPPKEDREDNKQILSPDQVRHLLAYVRDHRFELAVYMGGCCALRVGEVMSLMWSDFDMTRGTVTIQRTLWQGQTWNTKTTGSKKTLKLPEICREAVQTRMTTAGDSEWVFPTLNNTPVSTGNFHPQWKRILRDAGLPDITFHSLRAQVGSTLLARGLALPNVSLYLRHSNPAITARYYSFIISGSEDAASNGMDDALG